jgi:hypothetical protein
MIARECVAWYVAGALCLALVAEEFRIADARLEIRGYQEMARRVEEHNKAAIERTMNKYYKAVNVMDVD